MQTSTIQQKILGALSALAMLFAASALVSCSSDSSDSEDDSTLSKVEITITGSTTIEAAGYATLTAKPTFTGTDNSSSVTYKWEITSGSDYAFLSATSGLSIKITGKNTDSSSHKVTVKVTASYNGTSKTATKQITINGKAETSALSSVSIDGSTSIGAADIATLTAKPAFTGTDNSSNVTYKWEITQVDGTAASSSDYLKLESDTGSSIQITGKNTDSSSHTVTVKVTASYNRTSKNDTKTITVLKAGETVKDELTSVTLSANPESIEATGTSALTAASKYTGTPTITYSWEITSGSDYASLSTTSGESVTLTGKNTAASSQSVVVKVTASDGTNSKDDSATITVGAAASEAKKVSSVKISGSTSVKAGSSITLTATPDVETSSAYTWTITNGSGSATGSSITSTLTLTGATEGTVTVTASVDGVSSSAYTVTVTEAGAETYDIDVVPGESVTTYGWADVGSMSYPNTTNIIYIGDDGYKVGSGDLTSYTSSQTKRVTFTNAIASGDVSSSSVGSTAAIIILSGTVDLSDKKISDSDHSYYDSFDSSSHKRTHDDIVYDIGSNKTILGVNTAKVAFGGLQIYAGSDSTGKNVIIRNIIFWDAHGSTEYDTSVSSYSKSKASADNLVLEAKQNSAETGYDYIPTNIWIDHCTFTDGKCSDLERNYNHDGSLDMKAGKNVTVSYCEFTNHDKVTLLAPNDKVVTPEERQITFHHNYYNGAIQRMPRSRGCQVHIYNNYYNNIGTSGNNGYSLGPGIGSQYIVESNYFGSFKNSKSILKYFDTSSGGSSASTFSKLYATGNNVTFSSSNMATDGDTASSVTGHLVSSAPWTISYTYTADANSSLPTDIPNEAGTDKENYCKVIRVNGTVYGE